MKCIFKYFIAITIFIIISSFKNINVNANTNIETNDTKVYNSEVSKYITNDKVIIIEKENTVYILKEQKEQKLNGSYIAHVLYENYIYLILFDNDYYIYKINDNTSNYQYQQLELNTVNDINIFNNNLIIVGSYNKNSAIFKYNLELNKIDEYIYDGDGYQEFTNILIYDFIYVAGIKDAICNNDYYLNVGSSGQIKSFIFKLDDDFNIIDSCYFNELSDYETIRSIYKFNDSLSIMLEADELYLYEVDKELNSAKRKIIKTKKLDEIYTGKKNNNIHLYIYQDSVITRICYYNSDNKLTDIYSFEGEYVDYFVSKGVLYIYYNYNNKLYLKEVNEYHDIYINTLVCDYYNYDETRKNHFKVDSYFEDLSFENYLITPFFSRNIAGSYIAKYKAERLNGDVIYIETPLIVRPYLNVMEGGFYNLGSRLYFFGTGKLNGQNVSNGCVLDRAGENILEIIDANGNKKNYTFYVVEDYYNKDMSINIECDFNIYKGDIILLPVSNTKEVKSVIINKEECRNIRLVNGIYYLEFYATNIEEVTNYLIEQINYVDNTSELVSKSFLVRTLKEDVTFEITEEKEDGYLSLEISTQDKAKNILDIYLELYVNDKLILTKETFIKNIKDKLISLEDDVKINIYGKTTTQEDILLFSYEGYVKKVVDLNYEISFDIENEIINKINIKLDLGNCDMVHKKIKLLGVAQNELVTKYQVNKSYIFLYMSIIASILLIGTIILIYFKKKKNNDEVEI